jgi:hypothetical protein
VIPHASETWVVKEFMKRKLLINERYYEEYLDLQRIEMVHGELKQIN